MKKKAEKMKQKGKNDTFLTKKTYKISHPIQIPRSMLKWVRLFAGKFQSQNEAGSNVKMEEMGKEGERKIKKGKMGLTKLLSKAAPPDCLD